MWKTNKEQNFLHSKGFLLLLFFFLFVLVMTFFFGDHGILEIVRAHEQIAGLNESIRLLEAEKAALAEDVRKLRENPLALERKAREQLWLMKKSEKVIVIVPTRKEGSQ